MKSRNITAILIVAVSLSFFGIMALAAQDRFTLKAPNGVAFSEFRGYEKWQAVSMSEVTDGMKIELGNPVMINAYKDGIPGNGKPFPEGAIIAKIKWSKKKSVLSSEGEVVQPGTLEFVAFIQKDSKRFPETSGWGYALFLYDAASDTFKPYGSDSSFGKECYACHTLVKAKDYIFTEYAPR